jgi:hypothetical protein
MPKLLRACLLALPLLALPTAAQAWPFDCCGCPPWQVNAGFNWHLNANCGQAGFQAQAGPWYAYWPYEAHFQTPAPINAFPFWPATIAGASSYAIPAAAVPAPLTPPVQPIQPSGFQSASYQFRAPSYWYGR